MLAQQARVTPVSRRDALRRRVEDIRAEVNSLPYPDGIPRHKWNMGKRLYCKLLNDIVLDMDKSDDGHIPSCESYLHDLTADGTFVSIVFTIRRYRLS